MPSSVFSFALGVVTAASLIGSGFNCAVAASLSRLTDHNAKLWLTAVRHKASAGYPFFFTAHLRNLGKVPIYFPKGLGPLQYFDAQARLLGHHGRVPWLREGTFGREMNVIYLIAVRILPGKSMRYWERVEINRYFDMSMPGRYAVRLSVGSLSPDIS